MKIVLALITAGLMLAFWRFTLAAGAAVLLAACLMGLVQMAREAIRLYDAWTDPASHPLGGVLAGEF